MDEPIISPDGNFLWSGEDWIPMPPKSTSISDSVVMGDISNTTIINKNGAIDKDGEIRNLLELMIEEISKGNFQKVDRLVDESKRISIRLHNHIHESEFRDREISTRLALMRKISSNSYLTPNLFSQNIGEIFNHYNRIEDLGFQGSENLDYVGELISNQDRTVIRTWTIDRVPVLLWIVNEYTRKGYQPRGYDFNRMMKRKEFRALLPIRIFWALLILPFLLIMVTSGN